MEYRRIGLINDLIVCAWWRNLSICGVSARYAKRTRRLISTRSISASAKIAPYPKAFKTAVVSLREFHLNSYSRAALQITRSEF